METRLAPARDTLADAPAQRRRLLAPLWRHAPGRLFHDRLTLALMLGVLTLVAVSGAAGPLYSEAVSDASVRLVLSSVPDGAPPKDSPVVRLIGGVDPPGSQWPDLLGELSTIPGLGSPRVIAQTVSTELHPRVLHDPVGPVVTGAAGRAPVRLFGVDDPAARLVVVERDPVSAEGVWLPVPVAVATGAAPGDEVRVRLSNMPDAPTTTTRVAGTYAVGPDGRTPQEPPKQRWWADVAAAGFPGDAERSSLRAHLAVADLATTQDLARRAEDQLLWTAHFVLVDPAPRLADLQRTADAVASERRDLAARSELGSGPLTTRPGLASGIETLAGTAADLSSVAQRGASVANAVGTVLALALVVAAAGQAMGRRRHEVALTAGTGRRPVSTGLLHAAELLPAAVLAGIAGWVAARGVVGLAVGVNTPSPEALTASVLWCAAALVTALVAAGAVAATAARIETRRLEGRAEVRVPWVVALVAVAGSATVGLLSRPSSAGPALGPLDLLVPPLIVAATAAVGSRLFFVVLRRGRPTSRPPTRHTVVRWLARRRLQSPDRAREASVTIAATGLAMLVFSVSALASLEETVQDRAAVTVGANVVNRVGFSWQLDPDVAVQAEKPADGTPLATEDVPVARTPLLPAGQTVVWRTRTGVATGDVDVNLLVIDPATFAAAAAWGSVDGPVSAGRALLPSLAGEDAEAAATTRRQGVASTVPAILVGTVGTLDLEVGSAVTVDTLNLPVPVGVRSVLSTFPGTGSHQSTLVVPADSFFASQLNEDPRLRPAASTPRNRPVEFQTELWSTSGAAATTTLTARGLQADVVGLLDRERAIPVYVASVQARRYQIALGSVFGAVGAAAVVLGAIRLARRSPAADRMLAWTGTGSNAPAHARLLEVAVVLTLSAGLAGVAMVSLGPLASTLLEPGDDRSPPVTLLVPAVALAAAAAWLIVSAAVAALGLALAGRAQPAVEVLRGED